MRLFDEYLNYHKQSSIHHGGSGYQFETYD